MSSVFRTIKRRVPCQTPALSPISAPSSLGVPTFVADVLWESNRRAGLVKRGTTQDEGRNNERGARHSEREKGSPTPFLPAVHHQAQCANLMVVSERIFSMEQIGLEESNHARSSKNVSSRGRPRLGPAVLRSVCEAARSRRREENAPPTSGSAPRQSCSRHRLRDRKSTRLNSSHVEISYAVFCLKK